MRRFKDHLRFVLVGFVFCPVFYACTTPAGGKETVPPPKPWGPVPGPAQLGWHEAEYRMFVHFGMKTFHPSGVHLGTGREDPKTFNPVRFDARQWVAAAKAGGFEGIVLTTKHHDGFCNWRTDTTDHCVRSSPWKNGKGDIVREVIEACHGAGLSFGLYVSILDKHYQAFGSEKYPDYSDYYIEQIRELSTRYGPVEEYWFDGYKAKDLEIDYEKIAGIIRREQPGAVVYDSGTLVKYLPDRCLRWPGRHGGVGPDPEYVREVEGVPRWYPDEPSLILQGNWFHCGKPAVSVEKMQDYYLTSTGYGVTPLMNVSPNRDGLIDADTVEKLKAFKAWVDRIHGDDLAKKPGVRITADSVRGGAEEKYGPRNLVDGDYETYYAVDDGVTTAVIEVDLGAVRERRHCILNEHGFTADIPGAGAGCEPLPYTDDSEISEDQVKLVVEEVIRQLKA